MAGCDRDSQTTCACAAGLSFGNGCFYRFSHQGPPDVVSGNIPVNRRRFVNRRSDDGQSAVVDRLQTKVTDRLVLCWGPPGVRRFVAALGDLGSTTAVEREVQSNCKTFAKISCGRHVLRNMDMCDCQVLHPAQEPHKQRLTSPSARYLADL
jgi:hypothetical protein